MTFNTGNPVPSTDPRDLYDNAENLDKLVSGPNPFYPDRLGKLRMSWAGMENDFANAEEGREAQFQLFLSNSGYEAPFSYATGQTLQRATQTFVQNDVIYRIKDPVNLPYTLTGDWAVEASKFAVVADGGVRQALAAPDGSAIVGFTAADALAAAKSVETKLRAFVERSDFTTDAAFNANKVGKLSRDESGRLRTESFIAGTEELTGVATKDAFVVGRNVTGTTDCHGYADRTVIDQVTDYGGYGAFDSTVKVRGGHDHNHVYSFQDRVNYQGEGLLVAQKGFYSLPTLSGSGTINMRMGIDIYDISVVGPGQVTNQVGVNIQDLKGVLGQTINVGLKIEQSSGWSIYSSGGAQSWHKGRLTLGDLPPSSTSLLTLAGGGHTGFLNPGSGGISLGVEGDAAIILRSNNINQVIVGPSGESYALRPGLDNLQPLGLAAQRWSQVFAGTATISTSDAREKTEVRQLNAAEIAAAKDLAKEIGAFRFLAAVAEKGNAAREHIGMTVQRAIEVMESHGLDPFGYSFICYDDWDEQPEVRGLDGEVEREAVQAGNLYSFRFDGLLAFIAAGFEARLAALEAAL